MRVKYRDTIRLCTSCTIVLDSQSINLSYYGCDSVSAVFHSSDDAISAYNQLLCDGYVDLDTYYDCDLVAQPAG